MRLWHPQPHDPAGVAALKPSRAPLLPPSRRDKNRSAETSRRTSSLTGKVDWKRSRRAGPAAGGSV